MRSPETDAYLAALIDGEGSIGIGKVQEKRMRIPKYSLRVTIDNQYLPVLDEMKDLYGGFIHEKKRVEGWARGFRLIISCNEAMELLKCTVPYLRIKREQAELAIRFQEGMGRSIRGRRVLPKEAHRREYLYQEMKKLNQRGQVKKQWKLRLL